MWQRSGWFLNTLDKSVNYKNWFVFLMLSVLVIAAKGLFFKFDWAWIRILKDISSSRGGVKVSGGKLFVLSARRTTKPVHCRIFVCLCALSFSHSIWWWCMWWDFIYVNGGTMIKYYQYCPDKPGAEVSKKKTISQRKNLPIECAEGDRPARCPNHFFVLNEASAVPWWLSVAGLGHVMVTSFDAIWWLVLCYVTWCNAMSW